MNTKSFVAYKINIIACARALQLPFIRTSESGEINSQLDALLRVPRQSLYWEALTILQLSLHVLYLNSIESMCSSYSAFDYISWMESINSLLLVHGPLPRKMSQDRYAFAVVVVCLLVLFVSFLKQEKHFEFLSYGGSWHRATLGSVNLFKIIRGICQVWENAQT